MRKNMKNGMMNCFLYCKYILIAVFILLLLTIGLMIADILVYMVFGA